MRLDTSTGARLATVIAAGGLLLAGCGEKDEPSLGELEASTPATTQSETEGFEIEGEWRGELRQKGLRPFEVEATIGSLEEPKQNTVTYGGIECSGTWTFEGREGGAFVFREVIDRGEGGECKGAGTVTLTPIARDELDYVFRGGGVESEGLLERR